MDIKTSAELIAQRSKGKKCRICGEQALLQHTIIFMVDNGFGWMNDTVHLCENHAENLDTPDVDKIYLKSRLSHKSKVRQKQISMQMSNTPKTKKEKDK